MQIEGLQPGVAATGWGVGELCSCPQEECSIAAALVQESDDDTRRHPSGGRPPGPPIYLRGARSGDLGPRPAADRSGERSLTRDLTNHARADPAHGPNPSDPAVHLQPPTEVKNSQDQAPRWPMDYTEPELTPAGGLSRSVTSPANSGRRAVWAKSRRPTIRAKSGVRQSGELPSHKGTLKR